MNVKTNLQSTFHMYDTITFLIRNIYQRRVASAHKLLKHFRNISILSNTRIDAILW